MMLFQMNHDTKANDLVTLALIFMLKIAFFRVCFCQGHSISQTHPVNPQNNPTQQDFMNTVKAKQLKWSSSNLAHLLPIKRGLIRIRCHNPGVWNCPVITYAHLSQVDRVAQSPYKKVWAQKRNWWKTKFSALIILLPGFCLPQFFFLDIPFEGLIVEHSYLALILVKRLFRWCHAAILTFWPSSWSDTCMLLAQVTTVLQTYLLNGRHTDRVKGPGLGIAIHFHLHLL